MNKRDCYETIRSILKKRVSNTFIKSPKFLEILKNMEYENYEELSLMIECYDKIILTKDIRNAIFISIDDDYIAEKAIPIQRSISRGKKHKWIIDEFTNEDGMFESKWSKNVKVKNNEIVPTKNIFDMFT